MRVVLAGGGTAGHIFPTLAVARRLVDLLGADKADLTIVCGARELDRELYRGVGFDIFSIKARGIVGVDLWKLPWRVWRLITSTVAVWRHLRRRPPDVIVASGGYVSVPVLLAAWLQQTPRIIFSGDAQLGWATRVLAPLATVATVAFAETAQQIKGTRVEMTGYPLRPSFACPNRASGRERVGAAPDDALVLIIGGSQGAHSINAAVHRDLARMLNRAVVVHVAGRQDADWLSAAQVDLPHDLSPRYQVHRFIDKGFADLMAAADLIVTRSGATAVAELGAVGAPAVIVPGRFGAGHQIATAEAVAAAGAAVVLSEETLASGGLSRTVIQLLDDPAQLAQMRSAATTRRKPDAAGAVAKIAIRLADPACKASLT